jgi:N-acetylglutamate synthase-like GNAT family acetyltransferase
MKMSKVVVDKIEDNAFCIHTLAVDPTCQKRGIGTHILKLSAEKPREL